LHFFGIPVIAAGPIAAAMLSAVGGAAAGGRPDEARNIVRRHGGYDLATSPGPTGAAADRRV
jgi:hypothetical protein